MLFGLVLLYGLPSLWWWYLQWIGPRTLHSRVTKICVYVVIALVGIGLLVVLVWCTVCMAEVMAGLVTVVVFLCAGYSGRVE